MLFIEPVFLLYTALLVLILPLKWLLSAFLAAAFHELCHIFLIYLLGGNISKIRLHPFGAEITANLSDCFQELLASAAGPFGSFLLLFFSNHIPEIALCGLVQGIYNLLPLYPMDGGRILFCILSMISPLNANQICRILRIVSLLFLIGVSIWGYFLHLTGILPAVLLLLILWKEKNLAKTSKSGYNSVTIDKEVYL